MMDKKKYLLVYNDMQVGGIEKSIISLLNSIDYAKVDVDLLLLKSQGDFMQYIPQDVHIINAEFKGDFSRSFKSYLQSEKNMKWIGRRFIYAIIQKMQKMNILPSGINISYFASIIKRLKTSYDVAIAYVDWSFDYVIKYVKSERKYAYIHVNYDDSINEPRKDKKIFEQMDAVYTVSEDSRRVLVNRFPTCKEKIKIWNNIVDIKMHMDMADNGSGYTDVFKGKRILTVGRAAREKGLDIAIKVCSILKKSGYEFRWYYIGTGELVTELKEFAKEYQVDDTFVFLGAQSNPYRYFKECDLYVQCSRYEGYGLTVAEAGIFGKPRIVTNLEVFEEQIQNMKTGIMVDLDENEFAEKIIKVLDDSQLYNQICEYTKNQVIDNSAALSLFYTL